MSEIIIRGARLHNLKNVSLAIPKNRLVVFTGVSGSGKSTLAFDTLHREGQRQYMESLGMVTYESRPAVDAISGLSPSISVISATATAPPARPSAPPPRSTPICASCSPAWAIIPARSAARTCRPRTSQGTPGKTMTRWPRPIPP